MYAGQHRCLKKINITFRQNTLKQPSYITDIRWTAEMSYRWNLHRLQRKFLWKITGNQEGKSKCKSILQIYRLTSEYRLSIYRSQRTFLLQNHQQQRSATLDGYIT